MVKKMNDEKIAVYCLVNGNNNKRISEIIGKEDSVNSKGLFTNIAFSYEEETGDFKVFRNESAAISLISYVLSLCDTAVGHWLNIKATEVFVEKNVNLDILNDVLSYDVINCSFVDAGREYFISEDKSGLYHALLHHNKSGLLDKKVFTIKDMAEMDLNNNHRLFCYPCDLFYRANKEEE
jgi:hypothetical protein